MAARGTTSFWHRDGALCVGWTAYIGTPAPVADPLPSVEWKGFPPFLSLILLLRLGGTGAWTSHRVFVAENMNEEAPASELLRLVAGSLRCAFTSDTIYLRSNLSGPPPSIPAQIAPMMMISSQSAYTAALRGYFVVTAYFVDSTPSAEK